MAARPAKKAAKKAAPKAAPKAAAPPAVKPRRGRPPVRPPYETFDTEGEKGRLITKTEFQRLVGKGQATVEEWIIAGMPTQRRPELHAGVLVNTHDAIIWLRTNRSMQKTGLRMTNSGSGNNLGSPGTLQDERQREAKERADKYAIENARSRRELISVDEVVEYWGKMVSAAKRQFRSVPTRAKSAGILPQLTHKEASDLLRLIDDALQELSDNGVPDADNIGSTDEPFDEDDEGLGAPAQTNTLGVG